MSNFYLTDQQYLKLLDKVESLVKDDVEAWVRITPGHKIGRAGSYVTSSTGLCNNRLTTKDTARWPELFPHLLIDMKDRKKHHVCPYDKRLGTDENMFFACHLTCRLVDERVSKKDSLKLIDLTKRHFEKGTHRNEEEK